MKSSEKAFNSRPYAHDNCDFPEVEKNAFSAHDHRRRRTNFDRVLDDRNDYSNGEPMKMKKLSRKRRSMQKRLMGSTESLDGLEDLAASRASMGFHCLILASK